MTTNIYILRLEGGNYYIGKSDNVMSRYQQHLTGNGSAWTRAHKPISVERVIENASPFDEDRYTKEYMAKYGIDKVRGGSYVEVNLSDFHKEALKMEIWGAKDLCTQCGRAGHFVKDCFASTDVSGNRINYESESDEEWECEYCDKTFPNEYSAELHEKSCKNKNTKQMNKSNACFRCGRTGHYLTDCYASTHVRGYSLDSDSDYE
jgi:predicted GIY-YIG superfamily endonuclease